ncbi:MAG: hypothetical protein A3B96_01445 [Candidatus Spechtbacteria bacterium RIFCSPHIGHO2_02_FULL_43_15b]|nr:MAG: hypothetical protein A3B96_01445 [Candidatus Spechtbacteria bacterium RIFCSPHIGHO2_02_FULL_43_15b]
MKRKLTIFAISFISIFASASIVLGLNGYFGGGAGSEKIDASSLTLGLVAHWAFNEGSGQIVKDSSANNTNAVLGDTVAEGSDDPQWSASKAGYEGALDFDGSDDDVNAGDINAVDGISQMTVSALVKIDTLKDSGTIIGKYDDGVDNTGWAMLMGSVSNGGNNDAAFLLASGAYGYTTGDIISTGIWQYWTAVFNGSLSGNSNRAKFYLNGVEQSLTFVGTIPATTLTNAYNVLIGNVQASTVNMDGKIDEVRIYSRALSAAEVKMLYNRSGPAAHYKLDEGSGSTAYDSASTTGSGTITGTKWVTGKYGTALDFDGSDDVITVSNANPIDFDIGLKNAVTFSAWIFAHSDGENNNGQIIQKGTDTYIRLGNESNTKLSIGASIDLSTTDANATSTGSLTTNTWHHISVVWEDDSDDDLSIYIDGVLKAVSSNGSGGPASDGNNLLIGGATTNNFDGLIDDIRVYGYTRTAEEINLDYNAGFSARFGGSPNKDANRDLVGYWNFDEGTGQTVNDTSGSNNDGSLGADTGLASDDPSWTAGREKTGGGALIFDGTAEYVRIPDSASLNYNGMPGATVMGWVNLDTLPSGDQMTIYSHRNSTAANRTWNIEGTLGGNVLCETNDGDGSATATTDFTTGTWFHFACVWSPLGLTVYFNGVAEATDSAVEATLDDNSNIHAIGVRDQSGTRSQWLDGKIDEIRIYSRSLSASEIRYFYNSGGPIAYYKFDEGIGSTAFDSSNLANNGSITGARYVGGKYGTALDFDGSDDVVTVTNTGVIDFDEGLNSAVTFSAWINADSDGEGNLGQAIWKDDDTYIRVANESGGLLDIEAGINLVTIDPTLSISRAITINTWHHIVMIYEDDADDEITLYIDGIIRGSSSTGSGGPKVTDTNNLLIGGTTTANFDGRIDDVRVYNYARNEEEILVDYNAGLASRFGGSPNEDKTRGLVGYWSFDDGAGQILNDGSDANNDGILGGASAVEADDPKWAAGKQGNGGALDFDQTDDVVAVTANSTINDLFDFSLTAWFNADDGGASDLGRILEKTGAFLIFMSSVNSRLTFEAERWSTDGQWRMNYPVSIFGAWHHLAVVYSYANVSIDPVIYLDGVVFVTDTIAPVGPLSSETSNLYFGNVSAGNRGFDGRIDEIKIYNRMLSAAEVRDDFNQGRPIAFYKFEEGSGATAFDSMNLTADGSITGAFYVTGKYGSALDFDGSDDEVTVTNGSTIDMDIGLSKGLTFMAWINADSGGEGGTGRIFEKRAGTYMQVDTESGGKLDLEAALDLVTTDASINLSGLLRINTWHHVAMGYTDDDDDEISVYVDGKLAGTSVNGVAGPLTSDSTALTIGGGGGTTLNFDGSIDEFKVYYYERSASEILSDYNEGLNTRFR